MQKSIAFKTLLISSITILSFGCESEPTSRQVDDKFAKPATNNIELKRKRALLKRYFDNSKKVTPEKIKDEKKVEAKVVFPFTLAPDFADFQKGLDTPIGKISGDVFGQNNDVFAVLKTQCGEGSVIQVVFKSDAKFQISPPIPIRFIGLGTKKEVTYTEGRFNISVNFSEDNPNKLKGNLKINFLGNDGNKKNYIDLIVDGTPNPFLLPTKMKGSGSLPTYDWCIPTAYVGIKRPSKDWVYGYAHIQNVSNLNIPKVRVMLSDRDGMDLLLVPLARGTSIPANSKLDISTARTKGKNPAVLKIETWRLDEINAPEEATGANLNKLATTLLLDGKATVGLEGEKKKPWKVDIKIEDFSISSMMMGPFQDEPFSEIRIFGNLGVDGEMKSSLPQQPQWWNKKTSSNKTPKKTVDKP